MDATNGYKISLLFVENKIEVRTMFESILTNAVRQLFLAENSKKGLEIYKEFKPDVVVTDISKPTMLKMIKKMKVFDPDVNVIVMSSYSVKEFFLEAIKIGVNGYLVKPIEPMKLNSLIHEVSGNIRMIKALEEKEQIRKVAEDNLKKSLAEKELLLKEVHHRVKNNLQIISSILKMQERQVDDLRLKSILGESQNRIRTMALIHENLYMNETLANINFGNYVKSLAGNLARSYAYQQDNIKFEFNLDDNLFLPIDIGIPVGLIINELISNSFKHAFTNRNYGTISITLAIKNENEYVLSVGDDGVGMKEPTGFESTKSLGMRIVSKLLQQIEGTLDYNFEGGTKYIIGFKN